MNLHLEFANGQHGYLHIKEPAGVYRLAMDLLNIVSQDVQRAFGAEPILPPVDVQLTSGVVEAPPSKSRSYRLYCKECHMEFGRGEKHAPDCSIGQAAKLRGMRNSEIRAELDGEDGKEDEDAV